MHTFSVSILLLIHWLHFKPFNNLATHLGQWMWILNFLGLYASCVGLCVYVCVWNGRLSFCMYHILNLTAKEKNKVGCFRGTLTGWTHTFNMDDCVYVCVLTATVKELSQACPLTLLSMTQLLGKRPSPLQFNVSVWTGCEWERAWTDEIKKIQIIGQQIKYLHHLFGSKKDQRRGEIFSDCFVTKTAKGLYVQLFTLEINDYHIDCPVFQENAVDYR